MIDFKVLKPKIDDICRNLSVKRLGIYGSALSKNFSPNCDVDVLAVFDSDENIDHFKNYFELKEQLENLFKRDVDLIVDKPFRNPVFNRSVEKTRMIVYER